LNVECSGWFTTGVGNFDSQKSLHARPDHRMVFSMTLAGWLPAHPAKSFRNRDFFIEKC
jgi:hypothetical protein